MPAVPAAATAAAAAECACSSLHQAADYQAPAAAAAAAAADSRVMHGFVYPTVTYSIILLQEHVEHCLPINKLFDRMKTLLC